MQALMKIKGKYFLRHKCILCLSYLLIPILLLIFIIISLLNDVIKFRKVSHFDKYSNELIENRTFL